MTMICDGVEEKSPLYCYKKKNNEGNALVKVKPATSKASIFTPRQIKIQIQAWTELCLAQLKLISSLFR